MLSHTVPTRVSYKQQESSTFHLLMQRSGSLAELALRMVQLGAKITVCSGPEEVSHLNSQFQQQQCLKQRLLHQLKESYNSCTIFIFRQWFQQFQVTVKHLFQKQGSTFTMAIQAAFYNEINYKSYDPLAVILRLLAESGDCYQNAHNAAAGKYRLSSYRRKFPRKLLLFLYSGLDICCEEQDPKQFEQTLIKKNNATAIKIAKFCRQKGKSVRLQVVPQGKDQIMKQIKGRQRSVNSLSLIQIPNMGESQSGRQHQGGAASKPFKIKECKDNKIGVKLPQLFIYKGK